ncbi:hypothetical protein CTAM01_17129 [Colletotrichum tamarilloi]|uniref:Uncharacterized protein n=1 Tax=Colletotrichum tamarilloi TaxID=1209934 RepID=A0ABQ9QGI6_9PEZI|nr:uncharacterized protein CTAM01_17129 [Colletotrichum tamarilloi]KAK1460482.1 hypothetical protein CTAM01_17129 [Colletotrichum tamarilloi]
MVRNEKLIIVVLQVDSFVYTLSVQQQSTYSCLAHAVGPRSMGMVSCSTSRMAVESRHSGYPRPNLRANIPRTEKIMASRQQQPKKRDRTNENCDKAVKNIMWRCEQIRRRYGADVYVQVRFKSRFYEYTSSNEHNFPKSRAELATFKAKVWEKTIYPVPVTKSPLDYAERRSRCDVKGQSGVGSG